MTLRNGFGFVPFYNNGAVSCIDGITLPMEEREFEYSFNYSMTQARINENLVRYAPQDWAGVKDLQKLKDDLERRHLDSFNDLTFGSNWKLILIISALCLGGVLALALIIYVYIVGKRLRNRITKGNPLFSPESPSSISLQKAKNLQTPTLIKSEKECKAM